MHTSHSFRRSLGNRTENTANPAEANFSINLGKNAWKRFVVLSQAQQMSSWAGELISLVRFCLCGEYLLLALHNSRKRKINCTCTNISCHRSLPSCFLNHERTANSEVLNVLEATYPARFYVCDLTTNVTISTGSVHNS